MRKTDYLDTQQAANELGVHLNTLKRWLYDGRLSGAVKLGNRWRIPSKTIQQAYRSGLADAKAGAAS